jgi:chemotaxis protein MotB
MKRFVSGLVLVAPLAMLVLASGCADPKKQQIEGLNKEVEQLRADLASAQGEKQKAMDALTKYQQENQGLQSQLGTMQSQMGELESRANAVQAEAAKASPSSKNGWITAPGVAMISVSSDLLFGSGKAELTSAGRSKISEIAREIRKEYPSRDIYVIGHTDSDPIRKTKWKDNWELSAERALTVTRVLQSSGVSGKQLMAAGRAEYQPEGSKAKNRRVEIYAVEKSGRGGSNHATRTSSRSGKTPSRAATHSAKK